MRKVLIGALGLVLLAVCGVYGPAVVSFVVIPPQHGIYRYFRTGGDMHWEYFFLAEGRFVSADFPEKWFNEGWDMLPGESGGYLMYDYRGEFDGTLAFTRREAIIRDLDGREARFSRVFNLWEVWRHQYHARGTKRFYEPLAVRKREYEQMISRRMTEQGLSAPPAARAAKRPPPSRSAEIAGPRPLIAVREFHGLHSEEETLFALYADGTMVRRSMSLDLDQPYHSVSVPNAEQAKNEIFPSDVSRLAEYYRISSATDQDETTVWISGKRIVIYGPWRKPHSIGDEDDAEYAEHFREINTRERQMWASLPEPLRQGLSRIDGLRVQEGRPWLPEKIEVRFNEYEHAWDESVFWPREWPGLYDPGSLKHSAYSYSVFVPSKDYAKLLTFLATRKNSGAVMIDLNKMIPEIRFPFPGESAWRN